MTDCSLKVDHHRLDTRIDGLGDHSSVPFQHCLTGAFAHHSVSGTLMEVAAVGIVAGDAEEAVVDMVAADLHIVLAVVVVVACTADDWMDVGTGPGN